MTVEEDKEQDRGVLCQHPSPSPQFLPPSPCRHHCRLTIVCSFFCRPSRSRRHHNKLSLPTTTSTSLFEPKLEAVFLCLSLTLWYLMVQVMIKNLEQVLSMILNSFCDPHPRVRWAAINAIGQLSTDLGPDLQAHAASAVLNFTENCTPDILTRYLDGIVSKLLVLLQNGKQMVQEGALTALASVADSSEVQFQKYYDAVMPYLKAILVNANDKSNRMLRAKAMECISLVGMAVGKEKFRDDAKQVMDVLMSLQQSQLDVDDPTASYMLQDFLPYMGFVMPPLLQSAQLKPNVTIITSADSDTEFDEDDDRCPFSYCY
ncbi:hypothetical protein JHK84_040133 [Glycine max]|nr:hypothetical protein JHK84_040133 [Glycine max]